MIGLAIGYGISIQLMKYISNIFYQKTIYNKTILPKKN